MSGISAFTPEDLEHLVHEALVQIGWIANAKRLASRLARLHVGLPREDEFAVICTWLGKCNIIHKLDQQQVPAASRSKYQVPDLLAVFSVGDREVPVLIEVKSNTSGVLSFKPDYLKRLKEYAASLGLPLLVAWKHFGIWTLFDIQHLALARTNYNININKALGEGLLGVLAGDFSYAMAEGAGLHIRFLKKELLPKRSAESPRHEEWMTVIDDVYYTVKGGAVRRDLSPPVQSLFYAHNLNETQNHTSTHIQMHFTVGDDKSKFAHMALVGLLNWRIPIDGSIDWRAVAARPTALPGIDDFSKLVSEAISVGVVTHALHIQPRTKPLFMPPTVS